MTIDEYTPEELAVHFTFLDGLYETRNALRGGDDMYGCAVPLREEFHMPLQDARQILNAWMDTFNKTTTPAERASLAVDSMRAD